jgi:hypothetical protein
LVNLPPFLFCSLSTFWSTRSRSFISP